MLALFPSIDVGELGSTTGALLNPTLDLVNPLILVIITVFGGTLAVAVLVKLILR